MNSKKTKKKTLPMYMFVCPTCGNIDASSNIDLVKKICPYCHGHVDIFEE